EDIEMLRTAREREDPRQRAQVRGDPGERALFPPGQRLDAEHRTRREIEVREAVRPSPVDQRLRERQAAEARRQFDVEARGVLVQKARGPLRYDRPVVYTE